MFSDILMKLTERLLPKGRAFRLVPGGFTTGLYRALSLGEIRAVEDAKGVLNSILPDNDNFTADDAQQWEARLGIYSSELVPLESRKLAIKRKLNFPGNTPARQSYLWLQNQLRLAGFDVYVHENRFEVSPGVYESRDPITVSGESSIAEYINHGEKDHGEFDHGYLLNNVVANGIDAEKDRGFSIGTDYDSTFFVGGLTIGSFSNVDAEREREFRQIILRIKPEQTVGLLFINFV